MSSDAQNTITIAAEPKMGFIKGTVGDDFVIPCIDFIITATTAAGQPQQVAAADCQRMVWQEDRWVIGAGEEPAPAPVAVARVPGLLRRWLPVAGGTADHERADRLRASSRCSLSTP